jgi:antitoxin YefM
MGVQHLQGQLRSVADIENCTDFLYHNFMPIHTSYTEARANLAQLMDRVIDDAEVAIITRRKQPAVAMIDAAELERMQTALYILSSPENVQRINEGIAEGKRGKIKPQSIVEIQAEFGLEP